MPSNAAVDTVEPVTPPAPDVGNDRAQDVRAQMASTRTKLLYGSGSIAFGVNDQSFAYFLAFFYNQVIGVPAIWVGWAILLVMSLDAFIDPIVGQISDHLRTRLGRRHPFMYAAPLPLAACYILLWNPPHLSPTTLFYYLFGTAILVRTFITFYEIPSSSLVAELTPEYHQRTSFFAYRNLFAWLGGLTMTLLAFGVFFTPDKTHPVGQLNPHGYVTYSITGAVVIVIVILISAVGTHRFIPNFVVPTARPPSLLKTLREMYETISHRSFLALVVSALFSYIAAGVLAALNIYFQTFFWSLSAGQVFFLTAALIPGAIFAWMIATPISRMFGKKKAAIGLWIAATIFYWYPLAARILGFFPDNHSPLLIPLLLLFGTIGVTLSIADDIIIQSMIADVVEDSELRTGRRSEGLFFAARSLVAKAVSGVGGFIAGVLITIVHFPAHANPATLDPEIPKHLALVYFPVSFGLYFVALLCLSFYKIDRATHEENLRKLGRA